jgi:two-component system, OmpR family, response regulator
VISYCATYNYVSSEQTTKEYTAKLHALIIDDEIDICYLLKNILKYQNLTAEYVTSLGAAEKFLQESDPPVIFLDNHLSDGLGINHIRQIKKEHPASKVVMITAHDNPSDREKAFQEGADYFISKPFSRNAILKTIENINL